MQLPQQLARVQQQLRCHPLLLAASGSRLQWSEGPCIGVVGLCGVPSREGAELPGPLPRQFDAYSYQAPGEVVGLLLAANPDGTSQHQ